MWLAPRQAFDDFAADPDANVLIIRGATAGAFSAGAGIDEFRHLCETPEGIAAYV